MLSVITPCLNVIEDGRFNFFLKMMESIHRQSYGKFNRIEHLVIDGGSTDGTLDLLERYQDKGWIDYLVSEKDTGIYQSMNKGILASSGRYINIMNTDDFLNDLDYFTKSISVLEQGDYDFTHADRVIRSKDATDLYVKKGDEKVAFFRMPFRHQTMIMKRELFDEFGLFDERYAIAADYDFVLRMHTGGKKGYHYPEIVLCSLDGGKSSDRKKCIAEVSQVLFERYGQKSGLDIEECRAIYERKISPDLYSKICKNISDKRILESLDICYAQSV